MHERSHLFSKPFFFPIILKKKYAESGCRMAKSEEKSYEILEKWKRSTAILSSLKMEGSVVHNILYHHLMMKSSLYAN